MERRHVLAAAWTACLAVLAAATAPSAAAGEAPGTSEFELRLPRGVQAFGWNLDFSGQERLRAEHWDDVDLNRHADDTDGRFLLRSQVRADIRFNQLMGAVVELVDAREWDSDRGLVGRSTSSTCTRATCNSTACSERR